MTERRRLHRRVELRPRPRTCRRPRGPGSSPPPSPGSPAADAAKPGAARRPRRATPSARSTRSRIACGEHQERDASPGAARCRCTTRAPRSSIADRGRRPRPREDAHRAAAADARSPARREPSPGSRRSPDRDPSRAERRATADDGDDRSRRARATAATPRRARDGGAASASAAAAATSTTAATRDERRRRAASATAPTTPTRRRAATAAATAPRHEDATPRTSATARTAPPATPQPRRVDARRTGAHTVTRSRSAVEHLVADARDLQQVLDAANRPFASRHSMMRCAIAGPIRGRVSSSAASAVLRFTRAVAAPGAADRTPGGGLADRRAPRAARRRSASARG